MKRVSTIIKGRKILQVKKKNTILNSEESRGCGIEKFREVGNFIVIQKSMSLKSENQII